MVPPRGAGRSDLLARGDSPPVSHGLLEQLAARALALRFGDGIEGLARGVGLTILVARDLPVGVEVAEDDDVVALRDERETLAEIARHMLAPYPHGETDVQALVGVVTKKIA